MRDAFPSSMAPQVDKVLSCLPQAELQPTERTVGPITIRGERIRIPYRVYFPEPNLDRLTLSPSEARILSSIFSRHHNGFVRARYLGELINIDEIWVAPFVVQLIGEYVIEIIRIIELNCGTLTLPSYKEFAAENISFLCLTRQRAISYWNAYYRKTYPHMEDYPALRLLKILEEAATDP